MWHFILALISQVLSATVVFYFVNCVERFNTGTVAGFSSIVAILITLGLHGINESLQSLADDLVKVYGSFRNFQIDSKRDWKRALLGTFIGLLLFNLGVAIVY